MSSHINTIRLIRNLRKGKHEKFAIQKALARIRSVESGSQDRIQFENDVVGGKESHGQVNSGETSVSDARLRD